MAVVNYAELYSKALLQAFPYVLHFGALWNSPNKDIYKVVDADTSDGRPADRWGYGHSECD